jgi:hypothetical protein
MSIRPAPSHPPWQDSLQQERETDARRNAPQIAIIVRSFAAMSLQSC